MKALGDVSMLTRSTRYSVLILVALIAIACAERTLEQTLRKEVVVGAASSMVRVFKACEASFEEQHPEIDIQLHFAASGTLLQQLVKGAPIEVVIFADRATLELANNESVKISSVRTVAANTLVLVAAKGVNDVTSLNGITDSSAKTICTGNPSFVPLGRYAKAALKERKLWGALEPKLVLANSASQARQYVERGEVDAAILYGSDMELSKNLQLIEEVTGLMAPEYVAGLVGETAGEGQAMLFLDYISSGNASKHFSDNGFKPVL